MPFIPLLVLLFVIATLMMAPAQRPDAAEASDEPVAADCNYGCQIRTAIIRRKDLVAYEGAGRVMVRFEIKRSGELVQVAVEPGSAAPVLERAAIAIIQDASRSFPPFPPDMDGDEQIFTLPLTFEEQAAPPKVKE